MLHLDYADPEQRVDPETLTPIECPPNYYPRKMGITPSNFRVLKLIKDMGGFVSARDLEDMVAWQKPFITRRHVGVLWGNGAIDKFTGGKFNEGWSKAKPRGRANYDLKNGEVVPSAGRYWGVYYKITSLGEKVVRDTLKSG